ncbi:hypothetical protein OIU91_06840 [Streptomyces sp. NBC_01456]|uniref:hypothetical protein n=1 Tax=unclassified Streptomyces TaxID=2593676 RepID=UPI002E2F7FB7|nr:MULTISPECIES: hypothetical protein [unclassified Streptomyces]
MDGFIASPDSEHTMFVEGEDHGAWVLAQMPETVPTAYRHLVPGLAETENRRFDTVLMGRGTSAAVASSPPRSGTRSMS